MNVIGGRVIVFDGDQDEVIDTQTSVEVTEATKTGEVEVAFEVFMENQKFRFYLRTRLSELIERILAEHGTG